MRTLLNLFRSENCSHQFSWPRVLGEGRHYQTCLVCGAEYEYDWQRMQRGARILEESGLGKVVAGIRRKWKPRARRLKRDLELRYRVMGRSAWQTGRVQDVSQSGIFFRALAPLRVNQRVEMVFEMPAEILGSEHQKVIAVGCIVRCANRSDEPASEAAAEKAQATANGPLGLSEAAAVVMLAANIWDYTLLAEGAGESEAAAAAPPAQPVSRDQYC